LNFDQAGASFPLFSFRF